MRFSFGLVLLCDTPEKMRRSYQLTQLLQKTLFGPKPCKINLLSPKHLTTVAYSSATSVSPDSPESPDLPAWLLNDQDPGTAGTDDGDFVIPSLVEWVQSPTRNKLGGLSLFEPCDSDVDKVSMILNNHYKSTDGVVQALDGSAVKVTDALVSQILRRFNRDWVPAFGFFTWAKRQTGYEHCAESYNSMVDILGKSRQFTLMWELVEEMNVLNGVVSTVTMTKVIRRLAKDGRYEDAIKAFKGMERFGLSKDIEALNVLMDALVKEGSVELAHGVCKDHEGSIPYKPHTFNILIHGYCKARKLDEARKMMDEMEKHGFKPDHVSYTSFIESYCRERDFRNVETMMEEMEKKGCEPSVITFTIVMHYLGKAKQINEALEVYEKMKRKGCVPDSSFYGSLIFILCKSGRLKDAWDVFEDMKVQGVSRDTFTYNAMISCVCSHSQYENAIRLLLRMEEDSCKPNISTYEPLLKLCCRKNTMKLLRFLLDHMFKNDISMELGTYALLVRGFCQNGKLEHACYFFEEIVLKGMIPWDATYKVLIEELEKKNETEAKERVDKLMLQAKEQADTV